MNKMTLSVDKETAETAKRLAESNQTSVSAMFTQFVRSMDARRPQRRRIRIGPLTRSLTGILKLPPGKDYRDIIAEDLMAKHGTRK